MKTSPLGALIATLIMTTLLVGCSTAGTSTATVLPSKTTTPSTNQQPIMVTLAGPIRPYIPAGPQVEMTLQNVSSTPIIGVIAILDLGSNNGPNSGSYAFAFDISETMPLLPNQSVSLNHVFIGVGFNDTTKYPVRVSGTYQDGVTFDYIQQVQIVSPSPTTQVRLHLFVLAYNLGNFLRRLGLPKAIKDWSLRSLQVKLIKIGGRIVRHARQIVFQLAEVAVPRDLFAAILERISRLSLAPG